MRARMHENRGKYACERKTGTHKKNKSAGEKGNIEGREKVGETKGKKYITIWPAGEKLERLA